MYGKLSITRFFWHLAIFGKLFCCRLMNIFLTQFWTKNLLIHNLVLSGHWWCRPLHCQLVHIKCLKCLFFGQASLQLVSMAGLKSGIITQIVTHKIKYRRNFIHGLIFIKDLIRSEPALFMRSIVSITLTPSFHQNILFHIFLTANADRRAVSFTLAE